MKLLLTSAGIKNESIREALIEMLGKPIAESDALCISTSSYVIPGGPQRAFEFYNGQGETPMVELGWKSVGVLELTALPSVGEDIWLPWLEAADVLLVNGGDPLYLNYWMKQSGLANRLPSLDIVYVGLSAGSMVMAPRIGGFFVGWTPPEDTADTTLGLVDFSIFPHLAHEMLPHNTLANAEKWATDLAAEAYAIDDETAIQVIDGEVRVISEGEWKHFA